MPTQRKRIGFLPSEKVQKVINQICEQNKLSQSKVTGILVEEALSSKGLLNDSLKRSYKKPVNIENSILITNDDSHKDNDILNLDTNNMEEEEQMINDYIEFKYFKKIMMKNKRI